MDNDEQINQQVIERKKPVIETNDFEFHIMSWDKFVQFFNLFNGGASIQKEISKLRSARLKLERTIERNS